MSNHPFFRTSKKGREHGDHLVLLAGPPEWTLRPMQHHRHYHSLPSFILFLHSPPGAIGATPALFRHRFSSPSAHGWAGTGCTRMRVLLQPIKVQRCASLSQARPVTNSASSRVTRAIQLVCLFSLLVALSLFLFMPRFATCHARSGIGLSCGWQADGSVLSLSFAEPWRVLNRRDFSLPVLRGRRSLIHVACKDNSTPSVA